MQAFFLLFDCFDQYIYYFQINNLQNQFSRQVIFFVDDFSWAPNQHIKMISEGSCHHSDNNFVILKCNINSLDFSLSKNNLTMLHKIGLKSSSKKKYKNNNLTLYCILTFYLIIATLFVLM